MKNLKIAVWVGIELAVVICVLIYLVYPDGTFAQFGSLTFQNPTPANNSVITVNSMEVNISITGNYSNASLDTFRFNWNGTNTTLRVFNCTGNMSYVGALGGYCIDQYEASVPGCDGSPGSNCASYNSTNYCNTSMCVPSAGVFGAKDSDTGTTVNATSRPNVVPLAGVSQQQARQMCANTGKHLCTTREWLAAANILGTIYNLPSGTSGKYIPGNNSNTSVNCNTNYFCQLNGTYTNNRVCLTGSRTNCRSSEGVYDMVGNLWEWVNESITTIAPGPATGYYYINSTSMNWSTTSTADGGKYGEDCVSFIGNTISGRAVIRGGTWNDGADAGVFSALLSYAPSAVDSHYGLRCCSGSTESVIYTTYQNTTEVFSNFNWTNTFNFTQYNSTEWRFYQNVTNLSSGTYTYYGWANDTVGNTGQTDNGNVRYITVGAATTTTTTTTTTTPGVTTTTTPQMIIQYISNSWWGA